MPGLADKLTDRQIALLANYTRSTFGSRPDSDLTGADVALIRTPDDEMPETLRLLQTLAWVGVAAGVLVALTVLMIWWRVGRGRHKRQEA
ncbi:MAG: hypothetical protein JJT81_03095 [Rubellimicrobium sp.]|nr:hypothetical protein [Rubellimicrobium sp.]